MISTKTKIPFSCSLLGAGAIGTIFAAYLKRAGIKVYIVKHGELSKKVLETRIRGSNLSGDHYFPIRTAKQIGATDFILVATKATQVLQALRNSEDLLKNRSDVIILSNGMGYHEKVQELSTSTRFFAATTTEAAYFSKKREINHISQGVTIIGPLSEARPPKWLASWKNALPKSSWNANIQIALWKKLAINCAINPVTAVYNCRNGDLINNSELNELVKALCTEIEMVGDAAGLRDSKESLYNSVSEVISATAGNFSSMLQDVKAGRGTEIESITGYLVKTATKLKIKVPTNRKILDKMRQISQ